jgi:hypothetical protein
MVTLAWPQPLAVQVMDLSNTQLPPLPCTGAAARKMPMDEQDATEEVEGSIGVTVRLVDPADTGSASSAHAVPGARIVTGMLKVDQLPAELVTLPTLALPFVAAVMAPRRLVDVLTVSVLFAAVSSPALAAGQVNEGFWMVGGMARATHTLAAVRAVSLAGRLATQALLLRVKAVKRVVSLALVGVAASPRF